MDALVDRVGATATSIATMGPGLRRDDDEGQELSGPYARAFAPSRLRVNQSCDTPNKVSPHRIVFARIHPPAATDTQTTHSIHHHFS